MADSEKTDQGREREEIFSRTVRAGKRTYFFDVKATRSNEYYLTITESKRRFNNDQGKFFYEKHKLFLYKEDFEKFSIGLKEVIDFIQTEQKPVEEVSVSKEETKDSATDIEFEDLGADTKTSEEEVDKTE
ncbi:MAG: PUR family DNA/RNA-binding protein [Bacteroidales bacterium]|nr:PUR family DNA/RNA-binding protein [Bacteroidales bacterium]